MPNPTVELVEGDRPIAKGGQYLWQPWGDHIHSCLGDGQARSGDKALKIQSERGADAGWLATIPVKPSTEYRLSGWIKPKGCGEPWGPANVHGMGQTVTQAIKGDQDWTRWK